MSFDSLSPEILMKIFCYLTRDYVPKKIRLERVSRKFRDCIRNANSWKNDTVLEIGDYTCNSVEHLRAYLSHTRVITQLGLFETPSHEMLACLWSFSDKLKLQDFTYDVHASEEPNQCPKNSQIIACCLGKFSDTLTSSSLTCCKSIDCEIKEVLTSVLPMCKNLKHLELGNVIDINEENGEKEMSIHVLNSIRNLSLKSLCLSADDDDATRVNVVHLAAVCNSFKNNSLSSLHIKAGRYDDELIELNLKLFRDSLKPAAARAIKWLMLEYVDWDWAHLLSQLPLLLPNLTFVYIVESSEMNENVGDAVKKAGALSSFMHSCMEQQHKIELQIIVECRETFSKRFFDAIDVVGRVHSGAKHTAKKRKKFNYYWSKTISNSVATVNISAK